MKSFWFLGLMTLVLSANSQAQQQRLERPPQFVLISFDGSKSENFWRGTIDLADKTKSQFSYFISGVYFIPKSKKSVYRGPRHGSGQSAIGWGEDDPQAIARRTGFVWTALSKKFDIGSHANGHFDGGSWSYPDWRSEFEQFHKFIEGVFTINPKSATAFANEWPSVLKRNMKGFRAPLLAENANTQRVLKEFNYSYNASGQSEGKWPFQKQNGIWDIGLARITLAGSRLRTVAMDYNVFYGQCNGRFSSSGTECRGISDANVKRWEEQTYQSYMQTFAKNYSGNRAPFSVGHHFSLWNKGAYWRAMQRFVISVCTKPEVACITHKDMVSYMENMIQKYGKGITEQLNAGKFDRNNLPNLNLATPQVNSRRQFIGGIKMIQPVEEEIDPSVQQAVLRGDMPEAHMNEADEDMSAYRIDP